MLLAERALKIFVFVRFRVFVIAFVFSVAKSTNVTLKERLTSVLTCFLSSKQNKSIRSFYGIIFQNTDRDKSHSVQTKPDKGKP